MRLEYQQNTSSSYGRKRKLLILLVPGAGFEPATPRSTIWCSNHLSYPGTRGGMIPMEPKSRAGHSQRATISMSVNRLAESLQVSSIANPASRARSSRSDSAYLYEFSVWIVSDFSRLTCMLKLSIATT